jgi:hypothetical protein
MAWGSVRYQGASGAVQKSRCGIGGDFSTETSGPAPGNTFANTQDVRHQRSGLTADAVIVVQYAQVSGASSKQASQVNYIATRLT